MVYTLKGVKGEICVEVPQVSWFPGHMAKAMRDIKERLGLVDLVVEVADARAAISSRNPDILKIASGKPILLVLNKADLADPTCNRQWSEYYEIMGLRSMLVDCRSGIGLEIFREKVNNVLKGKIEARENKGAVKSTVRIMVLGVPNTGKSSLINKLTGSNVVKSENRPGVTRGNQWIRVNNDIQILDTPGVLPPKIKDGVSKSNLAFIGSIKDEVLDIESVSLHLMRFILDSSYIGMLKKRYNLENDNIENMDPYEVLSLIGKRRGFLVKGGEIDTFRVSKMFVTEFRSGKIGRITLEKAQNL